MASYSPGVFAIQDSSHGLKQKKKKRDRQADDEQVAAPRADGEPDKKRHKKKHGEEKKVADGQSSGVTCVVGAEEVPSKKKKKKNKSGKDGGEHHHQHTPLHPPQPQPLVASPVQTGTEAELDFSFLLNDEAAADLDFAGPSLPQAGFVNNNEDILRAFQELDLTRLAGVLRGLDLPSGTGDIPFGAFSDDNNTPIANTSLPSTKKNRIASKSSGISKTANSKATTTRTAAVNATIVTLPVGPSIATPEHTELLSTKWLSSNKLKELVEKEGLVYKKGKFSAIEEQSLKTAIENYRSAHSLTQQELVDVILAKQKGEVHNTFWFELAESVPARPLTAVYQHVQRTHHPMKWQGKWTPEEDVAVIQGVSDLGQAWSKISERVGRTASDCRDRWRNHLSDRMKRQSGKWTKEEEDELTQIVLELTAQKGKNTDSEIFWTAVSRRMKGTRGRQQCRGKIDSLSHTVKGGGNISRWTSRDAYILVQRVAALNVRDDSEIDWKTIPDKDWNIWSAHLLQRRFRALKHAVKDHEQMPFKELLEILTQKNAQVDESPSKWRKNAPPLKTPKSAVLIEDPESESNADNEDEEQ